MFQASRERKYDRVDAVRSAAEAEDDRNHGAHTAPFGATPRGAGIPPRRGAETRSNDSCMSAEAENLSQEAHLRCLAPHPQDGWALAPSPDCIRRRPSQGYVLACNFLYGGYGRTASGPMMSRLVGTSSRLSASRRVGHIAKCTEAFWDSLLTPGLARWPRGETSDNQERG